MQKSEQPFRESSVAADESARRGRIIRQERDYLTVWADGELYLCAVAGRFRKEHPSGGATCYPVIGDCVEVCPLQGGQAVITSVHERRNALTRRRAGNPTAPQVLAANIDRAFVVQALDGGRNFRLRTCERYFSLLARQDIAATLLLNKADVCEHPAESLRMASDHFSGMPVLLVSARTGEGLEEVSALLAPDSTAILLGPSGVGKSALLNALAGEPLQRERAARASDGRGRHSTTNRRMFRLAGGAWIIDTPGIREIVPWEEEPSPEVFAAIEEYAAGCRFRDCRHANEPGCAVQKAAETGDVEADLYAHYLELQRERDEMAERKVQAHRLQTRRAWKKEKYRHIDAE